MIRLTLGAVLLLVGCDSNDFESPSRVEGPRLLTIVAIPPEAAPGVDVYFVPFLANPDNELLSVEFVAQLSTAALAASAGQSIGSGGAPTALVSDESVAILPGSETERAIQELEALLPDSADGTPSGVVRQVFDEVGLTVTVEAVVRDGGGNPIIRAVKRFILTRRSELTTNPPPPRFRIGEQWVSGREAVNPFRCEPEGDGPELTAGATISLEPDEDADWLETFPSLDLNGEVLVGMEAGYYSWFSTGGEFSSATTRSPERAVEYIVPQEAGVYPLWVVVRDGHLGTSGCLTEVAVSSGD